MSSVATGLFAQNELEKGVLLPNDAEYTNRQESYWSATSKNTPSCIVRPTSAREVSFIIQTLVRANQPFAIRSGGHTPWQGANNIKNGVQVDLCFLNHIAFDTNASTITLGPGACWKDVYAVLEQHGRMVAGGRNGKIGVGGLLLGGGMTFFTGARGFACDDVLAYEVVLADGQILTADAATNPDLFHVLKGGSGNFGIVTSFTMRTFEHDGIWGGLRIMSKESTEDALVALQDFTGKVREDPDSNLLVMLGKMPDQPDVHAIAAMINVAATENAVAYEKFVSLPALMDTSKMTTVKAIVSEYDPVPPGWFNFFFNVSIKNDVRIFRKAAELHDQLVEELLAVIPDGTFLTECIFSPLPRAFGERSMELGGNAMGLSNQPEDGVLFVGIVLVRSAEQEAVAYPKFRAWVDGVREYAASVDNGLLPWVYMNYADKDQDPLGSYGSENVERMRAVTARVDPKQVFQNLCPGGFKLSRARGR